MNLKYNHADLITECDIESNNQANETEYANTVLNYNPVPNS